MINASKLRIAALERELADHRNGLLRGYLGRRLQTERMFLEKYEREGDQNEPS